MPNIIKTCVRLTNALALFLFVDLASPHQDIFSHAVGCRFETILIGNGRREHIELVNHMMSYEIPIPILSQSFSGETSMPSYGQIRFLEPSRTQDSRICTSYVFPEQVQIRTTTLAYVTSCILWASAQCVVALICARIRAVLIGVFE